METINTINLVEEYEKLLKEIERLQKAFTDLSFKAYAGMEEKDRENERLRWENANMEKLWRKSEGTWMEIIDKKTLTLSGCGRRCRI